MSGFNPHVTRSGATGRSGLGETPTSIIDEFGMIDERDVSGAGAKFAEYVNALGSVFQVDGAKPGWLALNESNLPGEGAVTTIQKHLEAIWSTLIHFGKILIFLIHERQVGVATVIGLNPLSIRPCTKDGQVISAVDTLAHNLSPQSIEVGENVLYLKDGAGNFCVTKIPQGFVGLVEEGDFETPGTQAPPVPP